jgi:hypothetical protein
LVAPRTLFSNGDRYVHPFGVSDGALIVICREKCLTLEFEGQSNVQQVKSAAAQALSVLF